jgi:DNA polymerase elongation subunit (family B)
MGIVLKRRDNAPIVKDVYGGIIDILMKEKKIETAVKFLKECMQNIVDGKYSMDKLVITKALRSGYKNPQQIAHKVLADRMGKRDSGNKPGNGDRIPYVYIENPDKKALQGERIETPEFIIANKLKINYSFYITNQIMKPLQQVFALVLEQMKDFQRKKGFTSLRIWKKELEALRKEYPVPEIYKEKEEALRNKEVKALLFDEYIRKTNNANKGAHEITDFFH